MHLSQLSSSLLAEADDCPHPSHHLVHPSTLNRVVENAIAASSVACKDECAANVGFVVADANEDEEDEITYVIKYSIDGRKKLCN